MRAGVGNKTPSHYYYYVMNVCATAHTKSKKSAANAEQS